MLSMLLSRLAKFGLRCFGWRAEGALPDIPRYVVIAAPHTSNWDFVLVLAFALVYRLRINYTAKHTLFRPPFGWFFRVTGGIPIDRRARHNQVAQLVERFRTRERMALLMQPEGSRKKGPGWKSGFYHVAHGAQVPIVCGFLDYGRKVGGFGPAVMPTGDIAADMEIIRRFYAPIAGKFPEKVNDVVLITRQEA